MVNAKLSRTKDRRLLDSYRSMPCLACGARPSDPAHIKSKGAGGGDDKWNVMPLCRIHHSLQHTKGWWYMAETFILIHGFLVYFGWEFSENRKLVRKEGASPP